MIDTDGDKITPQVSGELGTVQPLENVGNVLSSDCGVRRFAAMPCPPQKGAALIAQQDGIQVAAEQRCSRPVPCEGQAGLPLDMLQTAFCKTGPVILPGDEQKEVFLSHSTAIG